MATNRRNAKKSGVTPGKLILIGVLAVVLVVVIVLQTGGDSPTTKTNENESDRNAVSRRRKHTRVPAQPPQAMLASPRQAMTWPVMTVAEVIAHDPFALPVLSAEAAESNLDGMVKTHQSHPMDLQEEEQKTDVLVLCSLKETLVRIYQRI